MLLALDAHRGGASYRDIANVIYGAPRVAGVAWKSSALRDAVIALVADGRRLCRGDYRRLLRQRRKF